MGPGALPGSGTAAGRAGSTPARMRETMAAAAVIPGLLLHCSRFPARLLHVQQIKTVLPALPVPAPEGILIIILYMDQEACCNPGIVELFANRMVVQIVLCILQQMQQRTIEKRKNAPVQQKRNIPRPVPLKHMQQTCRNYRKTQQRSTRSGASGQRTTKNSTSRSPRPRVLSAGRRVRGSSRNSRRNGGPGRKTSRTPGGCAGRVTQRR